MPKKQSTNAQRARKAARQGAKYTQALRDAAGAQTTADTTVKVNESGDRFGGHEFEYEQSTDLFRCTDCRVYEVTARAEDGTIKPCTGMVGYAGDTDRVYLLLTENPELPYSHSASLSTIIHSTGIGRTPPFSWRDGKLLVESAPSVVDELARRIGLTEFTVDERRLGGGTRKVPAVSSIDRLTAEAGQAIIAENRAAYIAEYGEPA